MPIGVLTKVAKETIIKLPIIAFASPPPGVPAAGVLFKKKSKLNKPAKPLEKSRTKIHTNALTPIIMAVLDKNKPIKFFRFLLLYKEIFILSFYSFPFLHI